MASLQTKTFHHGGRFGDLLYALYTVKTICNNNNLTANLKLSPYHNPGWGISSIISLIPFLLKQPYISNAEPYELPPSFYFGPLTIRDGIDYDLHAPERLCNPEDFPEWEPPTWPGNIHLGKRTSIHFGIPWAPTGPWLSADTIDTPPDVVIHYHVRRATRPLWEVNYILGALIDNGLDICLVGGVEEVSPLNATGKWIDTRQDFNKLAAMINSCKVFYGVASGPRVLAEGLYKTHLTDIQDHCRNILPLSPGGIDSTKLNADEVIETIISKVHDA